MLEYTVDDELDKIHGCGVRACVSRVSDAGASYGDTGTVWVLLLGAYFTYNRRVGNLLPAVLWDVLVVYDVEGIGAVDYFTPTIHACSNALTEVANFIGVFDSRCGRIWNG